MYPSIPKKLDRVLELTSGLVDEQITEAERKELEQLLEADPEARRVYVETVQLHVDLFEYFSRERNTETPSSGPSGTPVLNLFSPPVFPGNSEVPL